MRIAPSFRWSLPLALLPILLLACTGDAPEPLDEVRQAGLVPGATMDPALFDTIAWDDRRAALDRGATVYAYSCVKCHGVRGAGDGGYQLQGRILRPPSFLADDWRFAEDIPGLREAIYHGNDKGMPRWGMAGLAARDIDAVARYIVERLWADAG